MARHLYILLLEVTKSRGIEILVKKANQIGLKSYINVKDSKYKNTPLAEAYVFQLEEAITELLRLKANPLIKGKRETSINGRAHRESQEGFRFCSICLR